MNSFVLICIVAMGTLLERSLNMWHFKNRLFQDNLFLLVFKKNWTLAIYLNYLFCLLPSNNPWGYTHSYTSHMTWNTQHVRNTKNKLCC